MFVVAQFRGGKEGGRRGMSAGKGRRDLRDEDKKEMPNVNFLVITLQVV
jgi:hypothetical protein